MTWKSIGGAEPKELPGIGGGGKIVGKFDLDKLLNDDQKKAFGQLWLDQFKGDPVAKAINEIGETISNAWDVGKEAWGMALQQQYLDHQFGLQTTAGTLATQTEADQFTLQSTALTNQTDIAKKTLELKGQVSADAKEVQLATVKAQKEVALETAKYQYVSQTFLAPRTYGKPTVV